RMIFTRLSLIVILTSKWKCLTKNVVQPCAEVKTSSSVVVLGSPVSASCTISEDCPVPIAPAVPIDWQLDGQTLPSSSVGNQGRGMSTVVIPNFNSTMAYLTCTVQTTPPQIVGGLQIRAGYLPSVPQNLHCQTNLTTPSTMLCSWDPGRDSHLPTKYSLHTDIRDKKKNYSYSLPPGRHHYTIPRSDFTWFSDMEIYVKAQNELGETTSLPVSVEPLSAAKFAPPELLNVRALSKRYGCLRLSWRLSLHESWVQDVMDVQVRLTAADKDPVFERRARPSRTIDQCGLLHGTRYVGQMRVRYRQSPWSEWSSSRSGVTLESAPSGGLDSWMKVSGDHTHKQVSVHLFWKPSKQFRANGQNVSYVVSRVKQPGERGQLCATVERYCTFQAPAKASKVYLSAVNAAGRSQAKSIHYTAVTDLTVTPYDDTSLMVKWTSVDRASLLGFVIEWIPLLRANPLALLLISSSIMISNSSIEPYKPYGISVYPRFKDGIGLPQTANAFSRQKAPSKVPKLRIEKTGQFDVHLIWDEISLDERNGIIQGYKVFYREQNVVLAKPNERRVLLKDLNPMSVYEARLLVSTYGGSRNGSTIHFKTQSFGQFHIKKDFIHISTLNKEPSLVYVSHLSFLDLPTKIQKEEDDCWLNSADETSDLGESICGSPFIPGYCGSNSDSVPYATILFSSPSNSLAPRENHAYLRSESTQPLLETEEAFTPKSYQNITGDKTKEEQCFFGSSDSEEIDQVPEPDISWDQFPFLRALAMNDAENE
uniref:Colony stimulating factor 3 receptor (granulocyte) n=1 Tax=Periophthalmus magnuspinnatus TaxID=409849 RepID=A0A3B3ZE06_9GOBI